MSTNKDDSESTETQKQVLAELKALRDTARLRLRLLSMEASERWKQLETKLEGWETRLEQDGESATETVIAKVREVTQAAKEFLQSNSHKGSSLDDPVSAMMTKSVSTCSPDDSLGRAAQVMWEGDCGIVPVVDDRGHVVGMLTDRDVCMACYTQNCAPSAARVANAMSRKVECCSASTPIEEALEMMRVRRVRRLPVASEDGELLGIVSLSDIARHVQSLSGEHQARGLYLQARALATITTPAGPRASQSNLRGQRHSATAE